MVKKSCTLLCHYEFWYKYTFGYKIKSLRNTYTKLNYSIDECACKCIFVLLNSAENALKR